MSYEMGILYIPPAGPVPRERVTVPWLSPAQRYCGQTVPWSTASFLKGLAGARELTAPCRQHVRDAAARMRQLRQALAAAHHDGDDHDDDVHQGGGGGGGVGLAQDASLPRLLEMSVGDVAQRCTTLLPKILHRPVAGARELNAAVAVGDVEARVVDGGLALAVHQSAAPCQSEDGTQSEALEPPAPHSPRGVVLVFLADCPPCSPIPHPSTTSSANAGIIRALCLQASRVNELCWGVVPLLPGPGAGAADDSDEPAARRCSSGERAARRAPAHRPVYEPSHADLQLLKVREQQDTAVEAGVEAGDSLGTLTAASLPLYPSDRFLSTSLPLYFSTSLPLSTGYPPASCRRSSSPAPAVAKPWVRLRVCLMGYGCMVSLWLCGVAVAYGPRPCPSIPWS